MRSAIARVGLFGLGIALMVCAFGSFVFAGDASPVPEIDGNSLSAGLAAASAAVLILKARRRTK